MTDGYEVANGLDPLSSNDMMEDKDGDGIPNFAEAIRGTAANDANSKPDYDLIVDPALGGQSGSDNIYSTIQEAIGHAPYGSGSVRPLSIIFVKQNTYNETVSINQARRIVLIGESGSQPVEIIGGPDGWGDKYRHGRFCQRISDSP